MAKTFIGITKEKPVVGQDYECGVLIVKNGKIDFGKKNIGTIKKVVDMHSNVYAVTTSDNELYVIQLVI